MVLKTYKPTSPGLRQLVIVDRSELYKGAPEKSLTIGLTKTGGRDNFGHVTSRRKGGGHKRKLRIIDFRRNKFDVEATVERIEYDPNRSAFIALICYEDLYSRSAEIKSRRQGYFGRQSRYQAGQCHAS